MELRLLGARGVREGSLVSIKVGSKRCYVPFHSESIGESLCKFSNLAAAGPEQVKLDIYEPVAHARLLVDPADTHLDVGLVSRPTIFGQEEEGDEDECRDSAVNTTVGSETCAALNTTYGSGSCATSSPSEDSRMSMEFEARRTSGLSKFAACEEEPGKSPQNSTRESSARDQGSRASKSSPYEEKHNLLKVMQTLLKSVMSEKPSDPFAYMIQVLQSKTHASAQRKARPQSAAFSRPPAPALEGCLAEPPTGAAAGKKEVRPQTAISRARPSFEPLPLWHVPTAAAKLSPKRPSEPLAPVRRAKLPPGNLPPSTLGVPRLGGGGPAPLEAEERVVPVGAARNVASRVRAPLMTQSAPSLALPRTSGGPSTGGPALPSWPSSPGSRATGGPSAGGSALPSLPSSPLGRSPGGKAREAQERLAAQLDGKAAELGLKPSGPETLRGSGEELCRGEAAEVSSTPSVPGTSCDSAAQLDGKAAEISLTPSVPGTSRDSAAQLDGKAAEFSLKPSVPGTSHDSAAQLDGKAAEFSLKPSVAETLRDSGEDLCRGKATDISLKSSVPETLRDLGEEEPPGNTISSQSTTASPQAQNPSEADEEEVASDRLDENQEDERPGNTISSQSTTASPQAQNPSEADEEEVAPDRPDENQEEAQPCDAASAPSAASPPERTVGAVAEAPLHQEAQQCDAASAPSAASPPERTVGAAAEAPLHQEAQQCSAASAPSAASPPERTVGAVAEAPLHLEAQPCSAASAPSAASPPERTVGAAAEAPLHQEAQPCSAASAPSAAPPPERTPSEDGGSDEEIIVANQSDEDQEAQPCNTASAQSTASPRERTPSEDGRSEEGLIVSDQPDEDQERSGLWTSSERRLAGGGPPEALSPPKEASLAEARGMIDSVMIGSVPLELWSPKASGSDAGLTEVATIPDRSYAVAGAVSQELGDQLQAMTWGA